MQPLIITVAPTGAELTVDQTPHLPITPKQLGAVAAKAQEAGASIIHVHCRDDDGTNTHSVERFAAALEEIRANSDLIVQFSTGGAIGMTPEERRAPLRLRPEMASLTCGTVNFGEHIFENSFAIMRGLLLEMKMYDVRPELEIFDKGHLSNARRLEQEGVLQLPQHVNFVLGVPGGLDATVHNLSDLVDNLPAGCTWSASGIGRGQLPMSVVAIAMGGHVRVGLEDNIYYSRGRLATNEELVARVRRLAAEAGREVCTPNEARTILRLRRHEATVTGEPASRP